MAGTQEILHGSLLKAGSVSKTAGDAAFQAFLNGLLDKGAGGTVVGAVDFDAGGGSVFSVDGGLLRLGGSGAKLELDNGAAIELKAGAAFSTAVNISCSVMPTAAGHLVTKGFVEAALAGAAVRFAVPRAPTTGAVDGVNKVFVFDAVGLAEGGEFVEVDGLRVYKTADYTIELDAQISETTVTFVSAPPAGVRVMLSGFRL